MEEHAAVEAAAARARAGQPTRSRFPSERRVTRSTTTPLRPQRFHRSSSTLPRASRRDQFGSTRRPDDRVDCGDPSCPKGPTARRWRRIVPDHSSAPPTRTSRTSPSISTASLPPIRRPPSCGPAVAPVAKERVHCAQMLTQAKDVHGLDRRTHRGRLYHRTALLPARRGCCAPRTGTWRRQPGRRRVVVGLVEAVHGDVSEDRGRGCEGGRLIEATSAAVARESISSPRAYCVAAERASGQAVGRRSTATAGPRLRCRHSSVELRACSTIPAWRHTQNGSGRARSTAGGAHSQLQRVC